MSGFLDTNILVYAYAEDAKRPIARALLDGRNRIGVQTINEFTLSARRKLRMSWHDIRQALELIESLTLKPVNLTYEIQREGMRLAERYELGVYDALHLAAALSANCTIFWTEDLHNGLVIDDRLTIRNPFA